MILLDVKYKSASFSSHQKLSQWSFFLLFPYLGQRKRSIATFFYFFQMTSCQRPRCPTWRSGGGAGETTWTPSRGTAEAEEEGAGSEDTFPERGDLYIFTFQLALATVNRIFEHCSKIFKNRLTLFEKDCSNNFRTIFIIITAKICSKNLPKETKNITQKFSSNYFFSQSGRVKRDKCFFALYLYFPYFY